MRDVSSSQVVFTLKKQKQTEKKKNEVLVKCVAGVAWNWWSAVVADGAAAVACRASGAVVFGRRRRRWCLRCAKDQARRDGDLERADERGLGVPREVDFERAVGRPM